MNRPFSRRRFVEGSAALAASAAVRPRLGWSADGKVLKIRINRDLQVLDPGFMIGGIEIDLQFSCLASLTVFKQGDQLGWEPSAFVQSVEQADPTHIKFTLKPGILWSGDNGELTTEDVKYSYERMANPANQMPWKDKWAALQEVQVVDAHNGVIVLKQPFAPLWYTTLCDGTGTILCKKATEKVGGKFTTEFPAICGPYRIKQWQQKQRVTLERNPLWMGPKPELDEIQIIIIEDDKSAELAYEAGEIDFTRTSLESLQRYQKKLPAQTRLLQRPGLNWSWMGMNTEHPKLKDIRVRQAIQNAVDVDSIIKAAYGGIAPRAHGIVPVGLIGHREKGAFDKPEIDKAKALLKEAGISDLSLTLKILNQTDNMAAAQIIQANLAEIGINVEIVPLDPGPFWNLGQESQGSDWKDLQLWIMRYGDTPDPSQMTQWYVGEQVGVWNWERWKDAAFDDLNKQGLSESDPAKRNQIYLRMQEIMESTGAYVWITFEPVVAIYRESIVPAVIPGPHYYYPWFKQA